MLQVVLQVVQVAALELVEAHFVAAVAEFEVVELAMEVLVVEQVVKI